MTGMLQPLEVVINQAFKAHIKHSYSERVQKTHEMMPMDHLKRATLTDVPVNSQSLVNYFARYNSEKH
jgi:hypothetical protein